jgi:hypothetical protein
MQVTRWLQVMAWPSNSSGFISRKTLEAARGLKWPGNVDRAQIVDVKEDQAKFCWSPALSQPYISDISPPKPAAAFSSINHKSGARIEIDTELDDSELLRDPYCGVV